MTSIGNPSNPKGNRFEYKGSPLKCRGVTLESMFTDVGQACFVTTRCVNAAAGLSSHRAVVFFSHGRYVNGGGGLSSHGAVVLFSLTGQPNRGINIRVRD